MYYNQKSKYCFILLFLFCLCRVGFAQTSISGKVIDAQTQKPIQYVNISIKGKARGTVADKSGNFKVETTGNEHSKIVFSHINYHKKEINLTELKDGSTIFLVPKQEILKNIIVSASFYEQPKNALTKPSEIVLARDIKDNFNSNMVDVLSTTPGFTQVWEYHSPIILRGLNTKRLVILKNGNRRIGTFPGGYFAQDMNIYDVKKIEIIKGPGSVIYGSGAISGIVNVIGKEPFGKESNKVNILSGYGSNNNELLEVANVCVKRENYGFQLNGKFRKTDEFVYGNGETAENSDVQDIDLSLTTGVRFADKQSLILNADYHNGDWGKPRGFNGDTKRFTKIRNEESNFHADIAYSYHPQTIITEVKANVYIDNGKRDYYKYKYSEVSGNLSSLELVHYKDLYGGGSAYLILAPSENNKMTIGTDGYIFRLDNPSDVIDYYNETKGSIDGYTNAGQQNVGMFIRDEAQLTEKLKIVSGLRYDYAQVIEGENDTIDGRTETRSAFSGNLGAVFSLNKNTHISVNAGRAFRMPTAEEMFTETISCKGTKMGNPDLNPEYSWNFDVGIRGNSQNHKFDYDMALFYNILDDYICEIQSDEADVDFTYKNTDALIVGGELSTSYRFDNVIKAGNTLYAGLGAAYVYGTDQTAGGDEPLFGIPPFKLNVDINYKGLVNKHWLSGYSIKFQTEYAAEQNRVAAVPEGTDPGPWGYEPSDSHAILNFALGLNSNVLPGNPKLRFNVKNLFDTEYQPFGSYIPAMGRNFKISLSFTIG